MANVIHARKTEKDELRFRVWSTISDSYVCKEMSEAGLREYTLNEAICDAIERHRREIDSRIQRARERGTSLFAGDARALDALWDKERE